MVILSKKNGYDYDNIDVAADTEDNDATEADNNDDTNNDEEESNLVPDALVMDTQREYSSRDAIENHRRFLREWGKCGGGMSAEINKSIASYERKASKHM